MDSRESQKSLVAAASAPILRKLYGDWIDREAAARSVPFVQPREAFARAFDKACKSLREAGFEPESGIKISSFPRDPKTFPGWLAGEWRVQAGRRPSLVAVLYGLDAVLAGTETELHRAWQKDDAVSRKRRVRAPRQPIETDSVPLADETAAAALGAHLASILSDELKGAQEDHAPQAVLRAIAKVFERAIRETIVGMQIETLSPRNDDADQVRTILVTMFSHPAAAAAIVDMVLLEDCEPARVALIAAAAGHDDTTMPFRWRSFLSQFLAAFERHAHTEADTLESPLHQQFSGPAFFQLRCNVAALIETVDGVVGRLTGGLAELDPTLHNRGFFLEYLGRNGHPKPFGGRSAEIALLNDWLYDPEDRPNLLLVAPAGRGKSALLVHWARQLPPDIGVVFVPVSLRFQTAQPMNFIPALAWGLGRLHGQIPDLSLSRDLSACRSLSASLMRKELKSYRFLVIIVDGLDEAGSLHSWAGQFSDDLASNVRIIVAARQIAGDEDGRRWMQNLCWDTSRVRPIRLGGLKRDGVGQVLRDMALPASYTTEDMIGVLHHLSQGDPLLVGLYAEQMLEQSREQGDAAWTIEDLRRLSPGITSFFERWLADQVRLWGGNHPLEETRVRGCLAVLAHALGPILAVELRAMMTRAYGLSDWTLRATIDALGRFVIGDGLTHGYALTHPRLNEFFASETFVGFEERRRVLDSFVRWGEETLNGLDAGKLDPSRTPHYLLHHLGDHLVQAEAGLPQQMRLLGPGWIRSWGTVDPTWRGLLGDVQRSWASARRLTSVSAAAG